MGPSFSIKCLQPSFARPREPLSTTPSSAASSLRQRPGRPPPLPKAYAAHSAAPAPAARCSGLWCPGLWCPSFIVVWAWPVQPRPRPGRIRPRPPPAYGHAPSGHAHGPPAYGHAYPPPAYHPQPGYPPQGYGQTLAQAWRVTTPSRSWWSRTDTMGTAAGAWGAWARHGRGGHGAAAGLLGGMAGGLLLGEALDNDHDGGWGLRRWGRLLSKKGMV